MSLHVNVMVAQMYTILVQHTFRCLIISKIQNLEPLERYIALRRERPSPIMSISALYDLVMSVSALRHESHSAQTLVGDKYHS